MASFMTPFGSQLYAAMRIMLGFTFLWHGVEKLFGYPRAVPPDAPEIVLYVAGPIELVGGVLIMIGFMVGPTAFLCSGLMAAAYWMAHGTSTFLPILNGGELAVIYCFVFLYMSTQGAGIWSVDAMRARD